jgi:uncharacterized membrane-anchored protein
VNDISKAGLSKVPQITLAFWIIKIAATTLGKTAGDALSMTILFSNTLGATVGDLLTKLYEYGGLDLGRISSSLIIALFMVGCIFFTSRKAGFHPGEPKE